MEKSKSQLNQEKAKKEMNRIHKKVLAKKRLTNREQQIFIIHTQYGLVSGAKVLIKRKLIK